MHAGKDSALAVDILHAAATRKGTGVWPGTFVWITGNLISRGEENHLGMPLTYLIHARGFDPMQPGLACVLHMQGFVSRVSSSICVARPCSILHTLASSDAESD